MESNNTKRYGSLRNAKKRVLVIAIICVVFCIISGITLAYVATQTDALKNVFSPTHVACEVIEEPFDGVTKSGVRIKNTGDTTAYIRATIVATWMSENGDQVSATSPTSGIDYSITLNDGNGSNWVKSSDSFWYYKLPVNATAETEDLIESCTVLTTPPDGYYLSVDIIASAIQSSPDSVVKDNWDTGVADVVNGNLVINE